MGGYLTGNWDLIDGIRLSWLKERLRISLKKEHHPIMIDDVLKN